MSEELKSMVETGLNQIKTKLGDRLSELEDGFKSINSAVNDLAQKSATGYGGTPTATGGGVVNGLASKMLADPNLQAWKDGGRLANRVSLDLDLKSLMRKAAILNNGDQMAQFDRFQGIVPMSTRPRWLWEYLVQAPTTAPAVEYLVESGAVRVAGIQAGEGVDKSESEFTFELKTAKVETFAHYVQMSRQVFADQPALAMFLQTRLTEGVWRKLEDQMLNGNGTSPQLSGILDAGNFVAYTPPTPALSRLDTIRDAMAKLQDTDYAPNLVILNPRDWANIEIERGDDGQYLLGNPAMMAQPMLWGANVHATPALPAGTFIVMDSASAMLWSRQSATMLLSDSHNGNFTKNLLVGLVEARFGFGVLRPEGVMSGQFA